MESVIKAFGVFLLFVVLLSFAAVIVAVPVMLIANYLFTSAVLMAVFGIPALTFWKAFWLSVICGLLFKSSNTSK